VTVADKPGPAPVLEARDLTVELGGRVVLEGVSFWIARGEFLCLCGPNGGGKTTFLKTALGLVRPRSGVVEVLGTTPEKARPGVGYLPQRKGFAPDFPATALDLIVANRRGKWPLRVRPEERERARIVLARMGGDGLLDRPLSALSGGETQRVFLGRALINDPALLLLDEPTAGVDARGRAEFLNLLAEIAAQARMAVVLVTHNQNAVRRLATRAVYLDRKVLAFGPPGEVLSEGRAEGRGFEGRDHAEAASALCEEE
jgi:ABC-type Mn2+/Zn2+ transport system ATPase subunit